MNTKANHPEAAKEEKKSNKLSFPALAGYAPPESSKDPLSLLKEIVKDKEIEPEEKQWLLQYSVNRFANRRKMAYWALGAILASLAFLFLAAIHDGLSACVIDETCTGILAGLSQVQGLLQWIEGFLAAIVATYYGMSSLRPSS